MQLLIDCQDADRIKEEKNNQEKENENDAEPQKIGENNEHNHYKQLNSDKPLTDDNDEIIAQAFIFFLAGFETTASTLSFCTYS